MARTSERNVVSVESGAKKVFSIETDQENPKLVRITMSQRALLGTVLGVIGTVATLLVAATRNTRN